MNTEDIYKELYDSKILKILEGNSIHENIKRIYNGNIKFQKYSLETFASLLSGTNVVRSGIGEDAQFIKLQQKYPKIEKLNKNGLFTYHITKISVENDPELLAIMTDLNSEILRKLQYGRSLDFYEPDNNAFIFAKTIDIGPYSNNIGGGQQDMKTDEIEALIKYTNNKTMIDNSKIWIIIDGRSFQKVYNKCSPLIQNNSIVTKFTSANNC